MARLVRRAPLSQRIMAYCNVMDFLLWLSEELETRDWDSAEVGTRAGLAASLVFMIARANSESVTDADQELFGDGGGSTGWVNYLAVMTVWILIPFSVINALYALNRTRQYRLFESNVERNPETPSARRVKVQSAPVAASPIRFISGLISSATAASRSHPDSTRDVWELSVWDPLPASLRVLCLFSPGHVLLYSIFLPLAQLDEKPSVTLAKCLALQVVMSAQMMALTSQYGQLLKDSAIIQKEVMNEYDTKFVRPRLNPIVRDAGVQVSITKTAGIRDSVEVGTPTTLVKRSFQTRPNPNYVSHVDPDGSPAPSARPRAFRSTAAGPFATAATSATPAAYTPTPNYRPRSSLATTTAVSTAAAATPVPARAVHNLQHTPIPPAATPIAPSAAAPIGPSSIRPESINFGGHMGIYTHQKSPLKKAHRVYDDDAPPSSPRNSREMAALEQQRARQSSPLKESRRLAANPFQRHAEKERYPSRV